MSAPLLLWGMHGLGDNLHQRALVRELSKSHELWLKTSYPQIYHDFPELHLVHLNSPVRVMAKNEARSAQLYCAEPPASLPVIRVSYPPEDVKKTGSVLGAMSKVCGVALGDFRMPVPPEWRMPQIDTGGRPLLVYRPLTERAESIGYATRNPDATAYNALFKAIRGEFFVVSVADVERGKEWLVGPPVAADLQLHAGELDFEALAGLFHSAALVFGAPGFATILAQAVGTPMVTVFGGFEDARSYSAGARFSPWLAIEPTKPCNCWTHGHDCDKRIDLASAVKRVQDFVSHCEARHELDLQAD